MNTTQWIAGAIMILLALGSLFSSLCTIWLIRDMKIWNGYVWMIFALSFCQLFYDISFFFLVCYTENVCAKISFFVSTFGGISTSIWTNIISLVVTSVVVNLRSYDIMKRYKFFLAITIVPSLILGIVGDMSGRLNYIVSVIYYLWRLISIGFNVCSFVLCSFKLYRMGYNEGFSTKSDPVSALVARFKYYPLWQACNRIGSTWYDISYGFSSSGYSGGSFVEKISLFVYVICNSSSGIGYFVIFLIMQPSAYAHLKAKCRCCLCGYKPNNALSMHVQGHVASKAAAAGPGADVTLNVLLEGGSAADHARARTKKTELRRKTNDIEDDDEQEAGDAEYDTRPTEGGDHDQSSRGLYGHSMASVDSSTIMEMNFLTEEELAKEIESKYRLINGVSSLAVSASSSSTVEMQKKSAALSKRVITHN